MKEGRRKERIEIEKSPAPTGIEPSTSVITREANALPLRYNHGPTKYKMLQSLYKALCTHSLLETLKDVFLKSSVSWRD